MERPTYEKNTSQEHLLITNSSNPSSGLCNVLFISLVSLLARATIAYRILEVSPVSGRGGVEGFSFDLIFGYRRAAPVNLTCRAPGGCVGF